VRRCVALSGDDSLDVSRAPEYQTRLFSFPDEELRVALQQDAAGQRVSGSFEYGRAAQLLRRHGALLQHAQGTAANSISRTCDAAAAQQRLLLLLDALQAACPAVLRGTHGAAIAPDALSGDLALRKCLRSSMHHCLRRLDALATFAELVPAGEWAQPPHTWRPSKSKRCDAHLASHRSPRMRFLLLADAPLAAA
jgi:hypothetical protein